MTTEKDKKHNGRVWKFTEDVAKFKRPSIMLDPPMEITPTMLHGLRMVDEIVIVVKGQTTADFATRRRKGGQ